MAAYQWTVISFDGVATTGSPYASVHFLVDDGPLSMMSMDPVEATIAGAGTRDVRADRRPTTARIRVHLSSLELADLQNFYSTFSEERGLVYLRCSDGATTWRIPVRVVSIDAESTNIFNVVVRVPYPVWETDVETTVTDLNVTDATTPRVLVCTNTGSRKTYPKITFTADAAKSQSAAYNDWPWALRTFAVSRMPFAGRVPVYLFDQAGAAARLATDTSVAGHTVRQTTGATTTTEALDATETEIDVTSAAAFSVSGGIAVIEYASGGGGTEEQIIYSGRSGNTLTGCVRGAGGTTAQSHASGVEIAPSATFRDGRDVAVWVNDVRLPDDQVWPVSWGSAASDVCINLDLPAARWVSLAATLGATTTGVVRVNESTAHMPDSGFLALENEIVHYEGKVGQHGLAIDVRGCWGTTATSHAAAVKAYANPVRIVVALGYAQAGPRPTSTQYRPAIQLPGSSNQTYKWGDESNDPNTIFFDLSAPDRSMQWLPGFDLDGNKAPPPMSISASKTVLTFKDDVPGDGNPAFNFAEISLPQGIDAGNATAVIADWTPSAEILNLEMFARDAAGVLKLIDQLQQATPVTNRSPAAFANNMYGLKLKGRYNIVTGVRGSDSAFVGLNSSSDNEHAVGNLGLSFTLEQPTLVNAIWIRMAKQTAGSQDVRFKVWEDSSNAPSTTTKVWQYGEYGGVIPVSGTTPTFYKIPITPRGAVFKPGRYWVVLNTTAAVQVNVYKTASAHQASALLVYTDTANGYIGYGDDSPWMYVVSDYSRDYTAPINSDQPVVVENTGTRSGVTASFDGVEIVLEPSQTVYVHRNTAFVTGTTTGAIYHLHGTIANTTTGDIATPDVWLKLSSTVEIDCGSDLVTGTRKVTKIEDGIAYPLAGCVDFSNAAEWLPMPPGTNNIAYEDDGLVGGGQIDWSVSYRPRKI